MECYSMNEDFGGMNESSDCFWPNDSNGDSSPPYRSRCNTWPKLVRSLNSEADPSASPPGESWSGGSILPLVSEESDEVEHLSNEKELNNEKPSQQFSSLNAGTSSSSTRRNPWGNCSYADLITQAIQSSPDQRLTVSQIYDWLVKNVPFFSDKGDSNSSAGWKNSIRHNLSLHPKFVRIQNEGTGKSSWWIINPDVKPGVKPSRRRAMSMETSSARQRKSNIGAGRGKRRNGSGDLHHLHHIHNHHHNHLHGSSQHRLERTLSSSSLPPQDFADLAEFRPRASSCASSTGRSNSPKQISSSSTDVLCSSGGVPSPWNNGNPLFNFVEKLNVQESMTDDSSNQGEESLDNIKLNDLNLDYETSKLLDSFLSPSPEESHVLVKLEKDPTPVQQKLKILEQRDSSSRGSSVSTSSPSSSPMVNFSTSFVPQPLIEEDNKSTFLELFNSGRPHHISNQAADSTDLMDTFSQEPQLPPSNLSEQQFKQDFGNDNSYIQNFSLSYLQSGFPDGNTGPNNNNSNITPVSLNSY